MEEEDVLAVHFQLRDLRDDHLPAVAGAAAGEEQLETGAAARSAHLADRLHHIVREDGRMLGVPRGIGVHDHELHRGLRELRELLERHFPDHGKRRRCQKHRGEDEHTDSQ
jgi:hypothetical protein